MPTRYQQIAQHGATGSASALTGGRLAHRQTPAGPAAHQAYAAGGFTLVEMLVGMAITLVMMAAVVTLFANVSNSVRNRRATIEMSSQLRQVRNVLQQDLQGATCPGLTWQRPESNHGYIEIIEGQHREGFASLLIDAQPNETNANDRNWPPTVENPEIDHTQSFLPASNLPFADEGWVTDGGGLGDHDDTLMLTTRNEHEPFIGRVPINVRPNTDGALTNGFAEWDYSTVESTLAEVVWFAVENPGYTDDPETGTSDPSAETFFGEPGMRTIYRRALLIAPWLNPYRVVRADGSFNDTFTFNGGTFQARPGLVRVLQNEIEREDVDRALAALVAFQERYDLSVRLEFDPNLHGGQGRWVILANTLGDLTKRENRYEHYSFRPGNQGGTRDFPFAAASMGSGYAGSNPSVVSTPDVESPAGFEANANPEGEAFLQSAGTIQDFVAAYALRVPFPDPSGMPRNNYRWRPFTFVSEPDSDTLATARAMLNDEGQVVRIVHGLVPLSGERRGEDVMMTSVLAFDLRVYDPGAPLFATRQIPGDANSPLDIVLTPSDPGWRGAYLHDDNMKPNRTGQLGSGSGTFPYVGQGAYVDMGYGYDGRDTAGPLLPIPDFNYHLNFLSSAPAWFFAPRGLMGVYENLLAPGYTVYDTWSFHYENNGLNEDNDGVLGSAWSSPPAAAAILSIDEGTNGVDDFGHYANSTPPPVTVSVIRLGVDDVGERETVPPYDKPLRGVQVLIRSYEADSRSIRQVRVNQHFMQE
jgi:type II secretory pathway pseudopilin PulG